VLAEDVEDGGRLVELVLLPGRDRCSEPLRQLSRTAPRIVHPVIARLHSSMLGERVSVLVFRAPTGDPLSETIAQKALSPADVVAVGVSLVSALQVAHRCQMLDNDLSPQTIWLDSAGRLQWTGLGMGWLMAEEAGCRGASSSLWGYLPPRPGPREPSDDTYALGVLLLSLVTGASPPTTFGERVRYPTSAEVPQRLRRALQAALSGTTSQPRRLGALLSQALAQ
jgi:serine/threonine protein kinase